eukprot:6492059-Amphidinium_carterae.3
MPTRSKNKEEGLCRYEMETASENTHIEHIVDSEPVGSPIEHARTKHKLLLGHHHQLNQSSSTRRGQESTHVRTKASIQGHHRTTGPNLYSQALMRFPILEVEGGHCWERHHEGQRGGGIPRS